MAVEWILIVCTSGWVLCGQERRFTYPTEAACYRALDEIYKRQKRDQFKYVICVPKTKDSP